MRKSRKLAVIWVCLFLIIPVGTVKADTMEGIPTYEIVAITKEYQIERMQLNQNSTGITFFVYKNGIQIKDSFELMKLYIDFELVNTYPFVYLEVTYQRDGSILCVPYYGNDSGVVGIGMNWTSTWLIHPSDCKIVASFNQPDTGQLVSTTVDFKILSEGKKEEAINRGIPCILVLFLMGYLVKPRFRRGSSVRCILDNRIVNYDNPNCMSWYTESFREHNIGWWTLLPFVPERKKICDVIFYAHGGLLSRHKTIRIKRRKLPEETRILNEIENFKVWENFLNYETVGKNLANSEIQTTKQEKRYKRNQKLSYQSIIVIPMMEGVRTILMITDEER